MPRRLRSFLGTIVLILLVLIWAFLAMVLAEGPVTRAPGLWQAAYYVVAGLGWVIPAGAVIWWMARPERDRP